MHTMCTPRQIIRKALVGYTMGLTLGWFAVKTPIHKIIKGCHKPVVLGKEGTKDPAILVATINKVVGTRFQTNIQTNSNNRHSQAHFFRCSRCHQHK